jgi:glycerol-3-phosphate acyltransferase PlsX
MKIAVDVMGGDFAPANEIQGAIEYLRENDEHELVLVGDESLIKEHLKNFNSDRLSIVHSEQVVTMQDIPTIALKEKKNSSMSIGLGLQKKGEAHAFVSAGNTGAQLAFSGTILKRIKGVNRAAVGTFLANPKGATFIMDVGVNSECKPLNLFQFAVMSDIMVKLMYGIKKPSIGLLSIGEEDSKGNDLVLAANKMFREENHDLNFHGNIEGNEILAGSTDIIVCDGFTGNIVIKMVESFMKTLSSGLKKGIGNNLLRKFGAILIKPAFNKFKKDYDYQTYGGLPLLGVNGISIICHGKSTPLAIKNAIIQAAKMHDVGVNSKIQEELNK